MLYSKVTSENWKRLCTDTKDRLTTRANKRLSKKRIIPLEYLCNKNSIDFIQRILQYIDEHNTSIMSIILSLGIKLLKYHGIYDKPHVSAVLSEYSNIDDFTDNELDIFNVNEFAVKEFDILGAVYQSYMYEGNRNIKGAYYTPKNIVEYMTSIYLGNNETFLDPCCGSGAFLLSVNAKDPNQIFGIDNDEIAVLMAKINMLIKYKDSVFTPQIYCRDFLTDNISTRFNYIITNPPWGAGINKKESFSAFFIKAFGLLKERGTIRFLFPKSILNVKTHKDIRQFIIDKTRLYMITIHDDKFTGVTTSYIDITCKKDTPADKFEVQEPNATIREVNVSTAYYTQNLVLNLLSAEDTSIIETVKALGQYSLENSIFALGIVTGNNKKALSSVYRQGMDKIYTGKEVRPYKLGTAKNYIMYDRRNFQQVAKDNIYAAPEKLVYKYISSKLVFAYADNTTNYFLNSANILIPNIPGMSIKTVMAFLNSDLFRFLYIKLFNEVKIIKGNLMELPFPKISKQDDDTLSSLVSDILTDYNLVTQKEQIINDYIFSMYDLTQDQQKYIKTIV